MIPRPLLGLLPSIFAIQAGFHGFTAAIPVALAGAGYGVGQIGLIVGTAAAVQMVAAPVAGALLDRSGPQRMLLIGIVGYLIAAGLVTLAPMDPEAPIWTWLSARALQGIGAAVVIPAALTLVPLLAPIAQRGVWLSVVLLSQNLTLALFPAASLWLLERSSLREVAIAVGVLVLAGAMLARMLPGLGGSAHTETAAVPLSGAARRRYGLAFRSSWTVPLLITLMAVAYWGVVLAYLPQRAQMAGTSSGLFFIGYGVSVLVSRVATGWLADRYEARLLVIVGLSISAMAILLLLQEPTAATMVGAGVLSGLAAGLVLSPLLLALSHRSAEADRGSAFAFFVVVSGGANALGSIGGAPIVENLGFGAALVAGLACVGIAGALTLLDASLRGHRAMPGM